MSKNDLIIIRKAVALGTSNESQTNYLTKKFVTVERNTSN